MIRNNMAVLVVSSITLVLLVATLITAVVVANDFRNKYNDVSEEVHYVKDKVVELETKGSEMYAAVEPLAEMGQTAQELLLPKLLSLADEMMRWVNDMQQLVSDIDIKEELK